ncbi:MAG: pyrroloquinoline quinone biosynthesis peptide chaperone PqqD [Gammaproteobacteria bacterium]|nr:MAG: pyrroloquinoline quinone biosynthesis peptide chaperone PqqD [Gammaproteobacteria bacterium]RKZ71617.1 MAG: pyrroloquinoline quinone biosynthesis peptide chaperone PqqD [Gammaproteobacteria bacterium]
MSETITVAADNIIEINPVYLFRWEEPQKAHVLLYPEGIVKVNETGAAILKLCDGIKTVTEIISELNDKYNTDVTDSVNKFLEVAYAKGWIRIKS